ncbi:MAG: (5-formylfuran-3-yl)methyl phosphate synthase [Planctomycetota bacterium]
MTRLIVSVRNHGESIEALKAGHVWIDVKNPALGSLGQAPGDELEAIAEKLNGSTVPVSAALGELRMLKEFPESWPWKRIRFAKVGLEGCRGSFWQNSARKVDQTLRDMGTRLVLGAYADCERAMSPDLHDCVEMAIELSMPAILIDTCYKDKGGLLDYITFDRLQKIMESAQRNGTAVALAGSLTKTSVQAVLNLRPDYIAARGAFCVGSDRMATIEYKKVKEWLDFLAVSSN